MTFKLRNLIAKIKTINYFAIKCRHQKVMTKLFLSKCQHRNMTIKIHHLQMHHQKYHRHDVATLTQTLTTTKLKFIPFLIRVLKLTFEINFYKQMKRN